MALSALSFIYLDLLLYSVSLSGSFLIFLHLLHTIFQHFFFIFSRHLIKPFPTKKVVPFLRSLCTSPCTCLMLFLLPLLCRQIISFFLIWYSLHLHKSSSYVVFLPLKFAVLFHILIISFNLLPFPRYHIGCIAFPFNSFFSRACPCSGACTLSSLVEHQLRSSKKLSFESHAHFECPLNKAGSLLFFTSCGFPESNRKFSCMCPSDIFHLYMTINLH